MKRIMLCLGMCLMLLATGCSSSDKEIKYDEKKVVAHAQEIVKLVNEDQYGEILENGAEEMKKINEEDFKKSVEEYVQPAGDFKKFKEHEIVVQDGLIVIGIIGEYEKKDIQFTISFDEQDKIAGFFVKLV